MNSIASAAQPFLVFMYLAEVNVSRFKILVPGGEKTQFRRSQPLPSPSPSSSYPSHHRWFRPRMTDDCVCHYIIPCGAASITFFFHFPSSSLSFSFVFTLHIFEFRWFYFFFVILCAIVCAVPRFFFYLTFLFLSFSSFGYVPLSFASFSPPLVGIWVLLSLRFP